MWVVYRKRDHKIVGCSADSGIELEKAFALDEIVKGLANAEAIGKYDALQVADRDQARAVLAASRDRVALRENTKGALQVAITNEESFLALTSDAPDVHPVDGIGAIKADGQSFTTIAVQKMAADGQPQEGKQDNDLLYLRADYGTLLSADGKEPITSIRLKKGQAAFRLVSETARRVATVQVFNGDRALHDRVMRIEFV
jgi:hypothetical protein